jgi:hypothetical protein
MNKNKQAQDLWDYKSMKQKSSLYEHYPELLVSNLNFSCKDLQLFVGLSDM